MGGRDLIQNILDGSDDKENEEGEAKANENEQGEDKPDDKDNEEVEDEPDDKDNEEVDTDFEESDPLAVDEGRNGQTGVFPHANVSLFL